MGVKEPTEGILQDAIAVVSYCYKQINRFVEVQVPPLQVFKRLEKAPFHKEFDADTHTEDGEGY